MIGGMRHKATLLLPRRDPDDAGGAARGWTEGPAVWAGIERLGATRDYSGERVNKLRRIEALIRYRSDIDLTMGLRADGVDYEIVSIEGDGEGKRLTLICEETRR